MKYCEMCGHPMEDGQKWCASCGAPSADAAQNDSGAQPGTNESWNYGAQTPPYGAAPPPYSYGPGTPPSYGAQPGYGAYQGQSYYGNGTYGRSLMPGTVPNHLAMAIVALVLAAGSCLGLILGIIAVVNAGKVDGMLAVGDFYGVQSCSNTAKTLSIINFVLIGLVVLFYVVIFMIGMTA